MQENKGNGIGTFRRRRLRGLRPMAVAAAVMVAAAGCAGDASWAGPDNSNVAPDQVAADTGKPYAACSVDGDCAALAAESPGCIVAFCDFGRCETRMQPAGRPCDDGSGLTVADSCDGAGHCIGRTASCGDGRCDYERENCWYCPADCGCPDGQFCHNEECIPEAVDGDGVCESTEDCGNAPVDCECGRSTTCVDGTCMDCDDACGQDMRECGSIGECECGSCPGELECDIIGRCVIPGMCGDGECLNDFEDCASCPMDCGCDAGSGCIDGQCRKCSTACRGIQCGYVGEPETGCECGIPEPCTSCEKGRLVTDCECLCAANGRECGKFEECVCGPASGSCLDRMNCVGGRCMPDCDAVCEDFECGSIGNCLCARCAKPQVCYNRSCETVTFEKDEYEPDDYPAEAADLGSFTDADGTPDWDVYGTMLESADRDWYVFDVLDTWGETLNIEIVLDGMSEDADLNLMACYVCERGGLVDAGLSDPLGDGSALFETASTVDGARCFESGRKWGQAEGIGLSPTCGYGFNDSGRVFIKVYPAEKADARTDYVIAIDL